MAKRLIYSVGFDLPDVEGFECISMDSDISLLDADIVLFSPTLRHFSGYTYEGYQGRRLFDHHTSHKVGQRISHWRRQLLAAQESGKLIIIFLPEKEELYRYTGEVQTSGTGRSARRTNIVTEVSNYNFIPIDFIRQTFGRGTGMKLAPNSGVIAPYWSDFGSISVYNTFFEIAGNGLIQTKNGEKTVGAHLSSVGKTFLLPNIEWDDAGFVKSDGNWSRKAELLSTKLRGAVLAIDQALRAGSEVTPEPNWASGDAFRLSAELTIESDIERIDRKIQSLEAQRTERRAALRESASLRGLLYEKGAALEVAVRKALELMGFDAEGFKNDESEFDAIFQSVEGRFLGEAEGKDNSAINVDKYSQLERNLTEDLQRDEVEERAIGVLFGNGFRLVSPNERGEQFTAKVLSAAASTSVSLVRTPDLFQVARYLSDTSDPEFATRCREALRDQRGQIVRFPDIPKPPSEASAELET